MRYIGDSDFAHDADAGRTGVLVTNLGTPDAPTPAAVRRYLAEFLSDPRVIEAPRWWWRLVLHGVVLRVRPRRSAAAYAAVWGPEGAPLLVHSRRQVRALAAALDTLAGGAPALALGMRYGNPSIASALESLRAAGVRRLLVLPLYPQYSATTTGSTFDAVARVLARWRWLPELRFLTGYHDDPGYLDALAASVREHRAAHGAGERLLFSFHGLPRRYLLAGDPYHCACLATARLVAERLALGDEAWAVAFQSRVGRERWLEPYTDRTLREWAAAGVRRVDVMCPGFSADCLETLEEIAMRGREDFLAAGGERLEYVPALNDRPDHVAALAAIVARNTAGWGSAAAPRDDALAERAHRARARGASR